MDALSSLMGQLCLEFSSQ